MWNVWVKKKMGGVLLSKWKKNKKEMNWFKKDSQKEEK